MGAQFSSKHDGRHRGHRRKLRRRYTMTGRAHINFIDRRFQHHAKESRHIRTECHAANSNSRRRQRRDTFPRQTDAIGMLNRHERFRFQIRRRSARHRTSSGTSFRRNYRVITQYRSRPRQRRYKGGHVTGRHRNGNNIFGNRYQAPMQVIDGRTARMSENGRRRSAGSESFARAPQASGTRMSARGRHGQCN